MLRPLPLPIRAFLLALLIGAGALRAQPGQPGIHPVSGRQIAGVMGWQGAAWLDRTEREVEEEPDKALDAIGVPAGTSVADVGAGSGYFTVRLASRVGAAGRVFATDIQPEMLKMLGARLERERIANVTLVQGTADDPMLPTGAIDTILMVDVYHELANPQRMLRGLHRALRSGGRLVLLEYKKEDPRIPIRIEHKMTVREAKLELEAEGFKLSRVDAALPRQHILVFTRASD
jgi:ubiquinone/menaquinone biosynthesis C-methylase UbiE